MTAISRWAHDLTRLAGSEHAVARMVAISMVAIGTLLIAYVIGSAVF
jgi:hypothetical protein